MTMGADPVSKLCFCLIQNEGQSLEIKQSWE